jgi:hypothetical protein
MPLNVPSRIQEKLRLDSGVESHVLATFRDLDGWIRDSKVVFFPEYTDHGEAHVNGVLETASALIDDDSWSLLNARDAAILAISAAIHDCALHLSEDSFLSIISSTEDGQSRYFTDMPWQRLWSDFLALASRYDGLKLKLLFGDTEPIRKPPVDAQKMTRRDRLLIGEFLRGCHTRIAEEIACHGIPGLHGKRVQMVDGPQWMHELSGLVARSHGIPIRAVLDVLDRRQWRTANEVHVPYLMAVLRVADYLQIQSERAPVGQLAVRALRSPLSQGEWQLHKSIYDLNWTLDDPEAMHVEVRPDNAATFLKTRALLRSIQDELDESWAVLGEVYGRTPPLNGLGLRLRRIRSNLDDQTRLENELDFAPYEAKFDTSRGELLKLLVRPLYGDHPEFGIRELLQNSVDACRERLASGAVAGGTEPAVTISISEEVGDYWLTVEDSGIGMTTDVIRNFFLKAGASFRSSDTWRKEFINPDGHARVLRSGRFGVGALAPFLLGDIMRVTTRHVGAERGLCFQAGLDDENIELRYAECKPGTTIRVCLDRKVAEKILDQSQQHYSRNSSDFYCLLAPSVTRRYLGKELTPNLTVPQPEAPLPDHWRRCYSPDFQDIQWSYWHEDSRGFQVSSGLVCNGIRVEGAEYNSPHYLNLRWSEEAQIDLRAPLLSVFDRDARLPLNLQRTALNAPLPFRDELGVRCT